MMINSLSQMSPDDDEENAQVGGVPTIWTRSKRSRELCNDTPRFGLSSQDTANTNQSQQ